MPFNSPVPDPGTISYRKLLRSVDHLTELLQGERSHSFVDLPRDKLQSDIARCTGCRIARGQHQSGRRAFDAADERLVELEASDASGELRIGGAKIDLEGAACMRCHGPSISPGDNASRGLPRTCNTR